MSELIKILTCLLNRGTNLTVLPTTMDEYTQQQKGLIHESVIGSSDSELHTTLSISATERYEKGSMSSIAVPNSATDTRDCYKKNFFKRTDSKE